MNRQKARRALVLTSALTVFAVAGCELAVDFDRTKIDAGSVDAAVADVTALDSPVTTDGGKDGAGDALADTSVDAPADGSTDALADVTSDVTTDGATADADDAGTVDAADDAPVDAAADADDSG